MTKLLTLLVSAFMVCCAGSIKAQGWGYATTGYWAASVSEASDGSVFSTGYNYEEDPILGWIESSNYVVKLNSVGELLWESTESLPVFDYFSSVNVMATDDGGCVVYGNAAGHPGFYKLDSLGVLVWDNTAWFDTTPVALIYEGTAVLLTDGRIISAGFDTSDAYVFTEVASDGSLIATHYVPADFSGFDWSYWEYKETGMTATSDGGYAFSAGKEGYKTVLKFASDNTLEWTSDIPWDLDWEYGYQNSLKQTSDGGYLLTGSGTSTDYLTTVRKLDDSGVVEWYTELNHGGYYEEGGWAVEMPDGNYMVWSQNAGDNSSAGWVLDNTGLEIDSVSIPIINCNWGYGEYGMEVWDAQSTADGGYLLSGRQYIEDCNQRFTVIKSNADGTFPDCIFNCVWPGDANNDGYALADDLFEIGINYGASGFSRVDMGTDWDAKLSRAWMEIDTFYWYILDDLKWSDCNGDGTINDDDTAAVVANLGLDHPLNNTKLTSGEIPLYLAPEGDELTIGLNHIPIMLGDEITSLDEIYGIEFTIKAEGEAIVPSSLHVTFIDGWMANAAERLSITKTFEADSKVTAGLVRKDLENTSGYGQIGTLDVVVIDNIVGKITADDVSFTFTDAKAINRNRDEILLDAKSLEFGVESSIDEFANNGIDIYPSLITNNQFTISSDEMIEGVEIMDLAGVIVYSNTLTSPASQMHISGLDLAAGQYLVNIISGGASKLEKIVIQ